MVRGVALMFRDIRFALSIWTAYDDGERGVMHLEAGVDAERACDVTGWRGRASLGREHDDAVQGPPTQYYSDNLQLRVDQPGRSRPPHERVRVAQHVLAYVPRRLHAWCPHPRVVNPTRNFSATGNINFVYVDPAVVNPEFGVEAEAQAGVRSAVCRAARRGDKRSVRGDAGKLSVIVVDVRWE